VIEVLNSYQSATLTTINNFHGTRVAVNGAITITIPAKSSLTITLTISTLPQSFFSIGDRQRLREQQLQQF
jgi:hypothetical protein